MEEDVKKEGTEEAKKESINNESKNTLPIESIKIKLSYLILGILILMIVLGALVFIISSQHTNIEFLNGQIEQLNRKIDSREAKISQLKDDIKELKATNESDDDDTYDDESEDTTYDTKETYDLSEITEYVKYSEMNNLSYKEVPKSKLDYNIIYDIYPITEYPQLQSVDYTEITDENAKKYSTTYYTYDKKGLKKKVEGIWGKETAYDGYSFVSNLSKISVSKDYNLIPRDYEIVNTSGELDKISNYIYDKYSRYPSNVEKIDLNGDNDYIYIVESHHKALMEMDSKNSVNFGKESPIYVYSYHVFNKDQEFVTTLYTLYDDFNDDYADPNVDIIYADIDNDSKMEIILHFYGWEDPGYVSVYKYENGKIIGDTNISSAVSP